MTIHENANRIYNLFAEICGGEIDISGKVLRTGRGVDERYVSGLSLSTNRNGDHSAYFNFGQSRVRISDHGCNADFRVGEIDFSETANEADILAWLEKDKAWAVQTKKLQAQKKAEFEEKEAARALKLNQPSKNDILLAEKGLAHLSGAARRAALKELRGQ